MKSILFFNNKGGVGKTTVVYHIAWMLSELKIKTIAVTMSLMPLFMYMNLQTELKF